MGNPSTILVVDDELAVLTVLQEMLVEDNYDFLSALSITDARELWQQHSKNIKLLITDLKLPDGQGTDLAAEVLNQSPDVKVILITGMEPDCVSVPEKFASRYFVFQKTTFVRDLQQKVNQCIGDGTAGPGISRVAV